MQMTFMHCQYMNFVLTYSSFWHLMTQNLNICHSYKIYTFVTVNNVLAASDFLYLFNFDFLKYLHFTIIIKIL